MRVIGHLPDETQAHLFADYLYAKGIDNEVDCEADGRWALWVHDEEQLDRAGEELQTFLASPGDPRYVKSVHRARQRREQETHEKKAAAKRFFDRDQIIPRGVSRVGRLTLALMAVTLVVGVLTRGAFSSRNLDRDLVRTLSISGYRTPLHSATSQWLPEVRRGEVWRLVTPIFLHFGPLHLLFNLMWLMDLGTMIERRQGWLWLSVLVLSIAVPSNLAQYVQHGPAFGGMSGVVFGLIGYVYVRGRLDVTSGLMLHRTTLLTALIWFVICWVSPGLHAANTVHAVGLGTGALWGFVTGQWANRRI